MAEADRFGPSSPTRRHRTGGAPGTPRPELGPVVAELAADGIVPVLLGGRREEVPERYERAVKPVSVPVLEVLGDRDDVVPLRYAAHPNAEFLQARNANHFDVIDPGHPSWGLVRGWLAAH
ncbi:hypothetical protein BBK82_39090 [Lentzea guizhouensis]|uniref:Alpha/beta hydrolase n=1 Tax=Lentzea guizhouensis TaxID=1586287 RepID=A0A1B2HTS0_9PSEU|nr:hypothetical protein [Lentzea guizhouensis]ANZ41103.1 hypothetical protein BBK82_39090 [Lentzea guizhouensis]